MLETIINQLTLPTDWRASQLEIQYNKNDLAKILLGIILETKETFDCCIDKNGLALLTEDNKIWNAIRVLKNNGIRVRFVAAVNEGNTADR